MRNFKWYIPLKIADQQVQTEGSVETILNIANPSKPSDCGNCVELELQLLQALYELRLCLKNVFVIFNSFTDANSFSFCPLLLIWPDRPQVSAAEIKSKWICTPKPTYTFIAYIGLTILVLGLDLR
jgi:hypothetical protein